MNSFSFPPQTYTEPVTEIFTKTSAYITHTATNDSENEIDNNTHHGEGEDADDDGNDEDADEDEDEQEDDIPSSTTTSLESSTTEAHSHEPEVSTRRIQSSGLDRCRSDDKFLCAKSNEYICDVQKCDGQRDCPDGEDEESCDYDDKTEAPSDEDEPEEEEDEEEEEDKGFNFVLCFH